jgi:hypothetical protein
MLRPLLLRATARGLVTLLALHSAPCGCIPDPRLPLLCSSSFVHPGTVTPIACPPGTYGNTTQQSNVTGGCLPCPAGYTCPNAGTVVATRLCDARYYCTGGDAVATLLCTPGSFCPAGSVAPTICAAGTRRGFSCLFFAPTFAWFLCGCRVVVYPLISLLAVPCSSPYLPCLFPVEMP